MYPSFSTIINLLNIRISVSSISNCIRKSDKEIYCFMLSDLNIPNYRQEMILLCMPEFGRVFSEGIPLESLDM